MLFRRKKRPAAYDKTGKIPVIRTSICTGEQTAGFKDTATGKFYEIMLLRSDDDLREFLGRYDVTEREIKREY